MASIYPRPVVGGSFRAIAMPQANLRFLSRQRRMTASIVTPQSQGTGNSQSTHQRYGVLNTCTAVCLIEREDARPI
ncbi:hypothetical protein [Oscillatoria sp. HE19RPO]|uniref:hypothetical protein n=1 Tax=Oscillatoria sp. HE19RPO TaxID=2954806 RepID=UPI0020C5290B|nr:hypothetical protein [Oscillatoria sp. HE19RPO]